MAPAVATDRPAQRELSEAPEPPAPLSWGDVIGRLSVWAGALACAALICVAYADAALHSGQRHYHLFWLGLALFVVPAALRLLARGVSRGERLGVVLLLGLLTYLPKYVRNPTEPLFHDEFAHWGQTQDIVAAQSLYEPNFFISAVPNFPGLHAVTGVLQEWAGVSTFQAGLVLLIALHLASLFMVHWSVERISGSTRAAACAALLYAINPSFLFFDTQFAYESMGIALFLGVVACTASAVRSERGAGGWWAAAALLAACSVITHHLSAIITVMALVPVGVGVLLAPGAQALRRRGWQTLGLAALLAGAVSAWIGVVAPETVDYIGQYVTRGLSEVGGLFGGQEESRTLFSRSTLPSYERIAAYAAPPLVFAFALFALWRMWRSRPAPGALAGLALFGLLYFPSLAFILSESGAEGARRSWAFTYLGLVALTGPALAAVARADGRSLRRLVSIRVVAVAGVLVVLIGNTAAGLDESYRFPGEYIYGSDTRSQTAENRAVANWMLRTQGPGNAVVSDRYLGLLLSTHGKQHNGLPSTGFPIWETTLQPFPSQGHVAQLRSADFHSLVLDRRMSLNAPHVGAYYARGEPLAGHRTAGPPVAWLEKYEHLPWTPKVYQSDWISAHRFNFDQIEGYGLRRTIP